jgi:hypothetical protein
MLRHKFALQAFDRAQFIAAFAVAAIETNTGPWMVDKRSAIADQAAGPDKGPEGQVITLF